MNKDGLETKLNFLQQEVRQLQEENKELRQLLQLNKEIVHLILYFLKPYFKQPSTNNSRKEDIYTKQCENNSERGFQSLFSQLYEENNQLYALNEVIAKQRDEARSQALIFEQICEDSNQRNMELQLERQNQLLDLQRKLNEKDQQLICLTEKLFEFQSKKKIKQKIMVSPTEDVFAVLNQIEQMRMLIGQLIKENKQLRDEKNKIQILIDVMQKQAQRNKSDYTPPILSPDRSNDESPKNQYIKENKQVSGAKVDESSYVEILPAKVNIQFQKNSNMSVPKLDLAKAQKLQQLNIQKQEEIEEKEEIEIKAFKLQQQVKNNQQKAQTPSAGNALNMFASPNKLCVQLNQLSDQNKSLQKELAQCRQKLQDEILLSKTLEDQVSELERRISDLESVNEILINSQTKYEQKWQKIHLQYITYKEYFEAHDQVYESARDNRQTLQTMMSLPMSAKHRKSNVSQNLREIAYTLYNKCKIEERLKQMEFKNVSNKKRSSSL
ncbi:unnamed protein product (macronuclear) [Paramecium tetraurelia]|uniref:Uncharacterized protein n=1 Tax=Paramecium tetraurelia TaxID=5888 RepID=A0D6Q5_PARTE|nr:uncharacterized protein GSPATT00001763001 [Paramecium tetraurelia]CAK78722.1 unnamed protein product [Paramecium tetraurelia]|eukprot:XP_001446119.1 hypothetical protein (macronuclear) [Paramecium tetraurelia strain d4-2]